MAFIQRMSETIPTAMQGNTWWYSSGNPYYNSGYGLPNCTCYAYGRAGEILGSFYTELPMGDGGQWIPSAIQNPNLTVVQTPVVGGIVGWYEPAGAGHVAVIEQDNGDGSYITSNSAWNGTYFWRETIYASQGYRSNWMINRNYNYQGCIVLPNVTPTRKRKMPVWMMLRYI